MAGNIFNAAEIVDIGIAKEKKRRDFYRLAAENFREPEIKKLFAQLADWEETHIRKFIEIRNSFSEAETTESYPGELEAYMNSLVDEKLYGRISAEWFGRNVASVPDAVRYGIEFEKDAILFFNELAKLTAGSQPEKIQLLIDEEKKHLVYLSELRRKYAAG